MVALCAAAQCRPLYQLHALYEEDPGRTRDCLVYLCRYPLPHHSVSEYYPLSTLSLAMVAGLIFRLTPTPSALGAVSFDYQFFFNLLLPPIILALGYGLHQGNFFRDVGTIPTLLSLSLTATTEADICGSIWSDFPTSCTPSAFILDPS
ncbi:hypothetical protein KCU71_g778, partial [Aureobasidium melanogenum]